MLRFCYYLVGKRRERRWRGAGTWLSKLKLIRSVEQMHLVMIVNKHATKYSIQVPSLSEVVERDGFLARGNSSFVSSRQSGLTSINRSKVMESTFH